MFELSKEIFIQNKSKLFPQKNIKILLKVKKSLSKAAQIIIIITIYT